MKLTHLPPEPLVEERLMQLRAFIRQLNATPAGQDDLRNRIKRFGACRRSEGETASRFYGRLRNWLDGDIGSQAEVRISQGRNR